MRDNFPIVSRGWTRTACLPRAHPRPSVFIRGLWKLSSQEKIPKNLIITLFGEPARERERASERARERECSFVGKFEFKFKYKFTFKFKFEFKASLNPL